MKVRELQGNLLGGTERFSSDEERRRAMKHRQKEYAVIQENIRKEIDKATANTR